MRFSAGRQQYIKDNRSSRPPANRRYLIFQICLVSSLVALPPADGVDWMQRF